jgi:hypothetical protein
LVRFAILVLEMQLALGLAEFRSLGSSVPIEI